MSKKPSWGKMSHNHPDFWRVFSAMVLLTTGAVLIGDGVVRWSGNGTNSSITAGCCAIFLGIIALVGRKRGTTRDSPVTDSPEWPAKTDGNPETDI